MYGIYTLNMSVAENLRLLEQRIRAACNRAARNRRDVTLVAVAKTRTADEVTEAIQAGVTDIGENRVQEAAAKKPLVRLSANWHLIGHLQTNKVRKALELFSVIQSVDSAHLAYELNRRCEQQNRHVSIFIEVNTSNEPTKFGVRPDELDGLVQEVTRLGRLELAGLMTIGPGWAIEDPEASRPCFQLLRRLRDEMRQRFSIPLPHLSMGMSSDFEQGIEEGATIIRIGTAIFGPRPG
ncbi:MAG: YggS family pyridoxal phosphate-dependent enzyme [candidate division WOR-3 bacterium]